MLLIVDRCVVMSYSDAAICGRAVKFEDEMDADVDDGNDGVDGAAMPDA